MFVVGKKLCTFLKKQMFIINRCIFVLFKVIYMLIVEMSGITLKFVLDKLAGGHVIVCVVRFLRMPRDFVTD